LEARVASRTPGERPAGSDIGAIDAKEDGFTASSRTRADHQTLADADQTVADSDQTSSDTDQSAADRDQGAADDDQAASDRLLSLGGDQADHDASRDIRDRATNIRQHSAQERVEAAASRDETAKDRDLAAAARDDAAAVLDRELAAREATGAQAHKLKAVLLRALESRRAAAADRAIAADARGRAAADRAQAASDRTQAARDRAQSELDRAALAAQLAIAETDQLTGARARAAGLEELEHEVARARRTNGRLVVGYADVIGLKAVNDGEGHAAGDLLLRRSVDAIRAHLRTYDLIIRLGGDEFLCVMSDATTEILSQRFSTIQAALSSDPQPGAIRFGVAELAADETVADLIRRADAQLPLNSRR
jgi:diguanylate cyclase (GGDEF)-like protein